jgi:hypothetical protein
VISSDPSTDQGIEELLDAMLANVQLEVTVLTPNSDILAPGDHIRVTLKNLPGSLPATVAPMSTATARPRRSSVSELPGTISDIELGSAGLPLPTGVAVDWRISERGGPELRPQDFHIEDPLSSITRILMVPPLWELSATEAGFPAGDFPAAREIVAVVTMTMMGVSRTREVSALVTVLPLKIPRVAAFFRDRDYLGYALLLIPATAPYPEDEDAVANELRETLGFIGTVASKLDRIAWFVEIATGVGELKTALDRGPRLVVRRDYIRTLFGVTWRKRRDRVFGSDELARDIRADKKISSMILVGVQGKAVDCFSQERFHDDDRWLRALIIEKAGAATVPTLDAAPPISANAGGPTLGATVEAHPDTARYDNVFRSIRFA